MRWPWQARTDRLDTSDRLIERVERVTDRLEFTADQLKRELAKLAEQRGDQRGRGRGPHAVG